ncbi:MAG: hypothetical protein WCO84_07045, partial [bacterium]
MKKGTLVVWADDADADVRKKGGPGPFVVEWEKVVSSVVDVLVKRPEVSRDRIALVGWSFCGLSVVRAAAYERRIAALVAD